jgi:hypothetical protein
MISFTGARSDVAPSAAPDASRSDDLSGNAHRQLIGYIGLVLPILLTVIARHRDGVERWKNLESISAYYYTGAVSAFVGMLVALALFLFTYRGYANKYNLADRLVSKVAALAALVVAFYPTAAPAGVPALTWWTPTMGVVHHAAAIVLFGMFAVFALWLFRLTADGTTKAADPDKSRRNMFYVACGLAIVVCVLWAGYDGYRGEAIFLPESVALVAFAASWLVKGYAYQTLARATRSLPGAARALIRKASP